MPTALITGASGFCGCHLARRLRQNKDMYIIGFGFDGISMPHPCFDEYIQGDIGNAETIYALVKQTNPDLVFHLAGINHGDNIALFRTNFMGSITLLESLRILQPSARILLIGSAAEYGHMDASQLPISEDCPCKPATPYGISKYAMTSAALGFARGYGMKISIARPFNIIGPGIPSTLLVGALLSRAKKAFESGGDLVIKVGNVTTERDFIAVEDAVEAYVRIIQGDHWGEIFNVCSGRSCSVSSVITQLLSNAPQPIRWETDPALLREEDTPVSYGSLAKMEALFGFRPAMQLADSLKAAWHYAINGQ
jgi:GDP-4-dehydro-6-deoxy-D-mannose reductase